MTVGVSDSTLAEMIALLRTRSATSETELTSKYPKGYILLGVANGKIVYEPRLKGFSIEADWDAARIDFDFPNKCARITIPGFHYIGQSFTLKVGRLMDTVPLVTNQPVHNGIFYSGIGPNMYFELLDASKNIFLIGFK